MLVAVTSCRSDGYYNQKAHGSTSKLPRKAPTNLKLFHELAVGVKDAYAVVGAIPRKPSELDAKNMSTQEYEGTMVLWDFIENLDFLLALVDEVAGDTVTHGALKVDQTFQGLRDVIKKGNRVLGEMLVLRERKYTLFFRLVQPHDHDNVERIKRLVRLQTQEISLAKELARIEIAQEELTRLMRVLSTRLSDIRTGGSREVPLAKAER